MSDDTEATKGTGDVYADLGVEPPTKEQRRELWAKHIRKLLNEYHVSTVDDKIADLIVLIQDAAYECGQVDESERLRSEREAARQREARLREAVELTEASETAWANCPDCQETLRFPELCDSCIDLADEARCARRAALQETSDEG